MKKYEYQTRMIDAKGFFGGKVNIEQYTAELNEMGREGWELIETTASNQDFGSTRYLICVFKRELE